MNNDRLETYGKWKNYLGCGNPEAKIWIIGIEEGGEVKVNEGQSLEAAVAEYFDSTLCKFNKLNMNGLGEIYFQSDEGLTNSELDKPSPVWSGIYKITQKIFPRPSLFLIRRDSDVFISNIYPLGNKNLKNWEYECIGLSKKQYIHDMSNARSELFQKHIKSKIVIFHGKSHWHEAYKMLGVKEDDFDDVAVLGCLKPWLRVHKTKKVIFTRHFANGMPNVLLDEISKIVRGWV